ncbi:hypothetical protein KIPB_016110, partial [Kipferlia bialata]|eukprot:g16110.t1
MDIEVSPAHLIPKLISAHAQLISLSLSLPLHPLTTQLISAHAQLRREPHSAAATAPGGSTIFT